MYNGLVRGRNRVKEAYVGHRRAAEAARQPDPEPRRDRQGLRRSRARHLRRGHAGAGSLAAGDDARRTPPQANNMLTQALGHLFAVAEAYPQLQAAQNFRELQAELSDIEEKIAFARQFYNTNVLDYNNRSARSRRASSPGCSASLRSSSSRPKKRPARTCTSISGRRRRPRRPAATPAPPAGPRRKANRREWLRWPRSRTSGSLSTTA